MPNELKNQIDTSDAVRGLIAALTADTPDLDAELLFWTLIEANATAEEAFKSLAELTVHYLRSVPSTTNPQISWLNITDDLPSRSSP